MFTNPPKVAVRILAVTFFILLSFSGLPLHAGAGVHALPVQADGGDQLRPLHAGAGVHALPVQADGGDQLRPLQAGAGTLAQPMQVTVGPQMHPDETVPANAASRDVVESSQNTRGAVSGRVTDAETGEPVSYVSVVLVETNRSGTGHEDGRFILPNVVPGTYTLRVHRVGYTAVSRAVEIPASDTLHVEISMRSSAFQSRAIEVTGRRYNGDDVVTAEMHIGGPELRQQLGRTLAETLQNEPGMVQSTMGPAPARPVLRGLSGDRLVLLEDGRTTGDVSTSAPDHAVTIDPLNSQYIEILRGPAALVYTSNAVGGVVNVVRGQIPTELPAHFHGAASFQGETVNRGMTAGIATYSSVGRYALRGDFGMRTAADIHTPEGQLDNTAIQTLHGGLGASLITDNGLLGASANAFISSYGIPGNFTGSHPNGVKIDLQRFQGDLRLETTPQFIPWARMLRLDYTLSYYYHEEIEFSPARQAFDILGYSSELVTNTFSARLFHDELGLADKGTMGVLLQHRFSNSGGFTFTPVTNEYQAALFTYQTHRMADWNVETGFRGDIFTLVPVREVETAIGLRRQRTLANISGGIKATYPLTDQLQTSFFAMRTVRMPGSEELYSEGPHLPAYSFEVGNPELNEEVGHGLEVSLRYATEHLGVQTSVFYYDFSNYLYPRATGEESIRRPLPIYQFTGDAARLAGAELLIESEPVRGLSVNTTLSYVQGDLTERDEALPFIPPLTGKLDVKYTWRVFTAGSTLRFAAEQNRLGEFEEATDGFGVYDAFLQGHITHGTHMHTFSLTLENLTNATYRMHLSRVKSIMPEPGRNIKLLYRMYF